MWLLKMFSRAWLLTTLLAWTGAAVCIRLGIWQLDRLEQRRAFNQQILEMSALPPLDLNAGQFDDLTAMEWRKVKVMGEYDFANQFALRNQVHNDEYGYHLIAPLRFSGGTILVDRGFIPAATNALPADWSQYDAPGEVRVAGQIRLGDDVQIGGNPESRGVGGDSLRYFNSIRLMDMSALLPYPALPVYIQPDVMENAAPPIPYQPEVELTEGSHFGYALQWFSFAAILFFGYPFYLRRELRNSVG